MLLLFFFFLGVTDAVVARETPSVSCFGYHCEGYVVSNGFHLGEDADPSGFVAGVPPQKEVGQVARIARQQGSRYRYTASQGAMLLLSSVLLVLLLLLFPTGTLAVAADADAAASVFFVWMEKAMPHRRMNPDGLEGRHCIACDDGQRALSVDVGISFGVSTMIPNGTAWVLICSRVRTIYIYN